MFHARGVGDLYRNGGGGVVSRFYEVKFPTTRESAARIGAAICDHYGYDRLVVAYHDPLGDVKKILVDRGE